MRCMMDAEVDGGSGMDGRDDGGCVDAQLTNSAMLSHLMIPARGLLERRRKKLKILAVLRSKQPTRFS